MVDGDQEIWLIPQSCGSAPAMLILAFPALVFQRAALPPSIGAWSLGDSFSDRRVLRRRRMLGDGGLDHDGRRDRVGGQVRLREVFKQISSLVPGGGNGSSALSGNTGVDAGAGAKIDSGARR